MSLVRAPIFLALLGLVACSSIWVQPGTRAIDGAYTVETPVAWRRHAFSEKVDAWTAGDPREEQLVFVTGLAPGEALLPERGPFPRYETGMTPDMIAQFLVNSHVLEHGHPKAAVHRTWPHPFGSVQGFRFEYGYTTKFNVDVHGLGAGAVKDGKLYLIYLEAADEWRFKGLRSVVEQIMDSATL